MVPKGSDTIRSCGPVAVDVVLLEEVCHSGGALRSVSQDSLNITVRQLRAASGQDVASTTNCLVAAMSPVMMIMD